MNFDQMTELQKRIATAVVLIPVVLLCVFWLETQGFKLVMCVVLALGAWEWCRLIGITALPTQVSFIVLCLGIAFVSQFLPAALVYCLSSLWWLCALYLVMTYPKSDKLWKHSRPLMVVMGVLILVPTWLGVVALQADNAWKMLFVFMLVWSADIGAYFAGRRFGKNKLAPLVSPGKSIEGVVGGLFIALLMGLSLKSFVGLEHLSAFSAVIIFSTVVLFSVVGDLFESLFKRSAGVKDSSQLLPGHGGVLDRIDSLNAAVPIYFSALFLFS